MPYGSIVPITCIGDIKLASGLQLQQVLWIPDFKFNLLSGPVLFVDLF